MAELLVDPWHYARPQLAGSYLDQFARGLVSARGIFANRRMGKTEFLEKDLMPAAQTARYLTAYVNLWDAREHPASAVVAAIAEATEPRGLSKWLKKLDKPLKKVKATGKVPGIGEGSLEAELETAPAAAPVLSELVRGFGTKGKNKLLLVLDEAQVLADPAHTNLAHALRAALDSKKAVIKVVFAGSSEPTLRRMFGERRQPFYNWAALEPFELLGEGFVDAMVARVNSVSKFRLKVGEAKAAFDALQRTPEFFRRYLDRYVTCPELGSRAALDYTASHVFGDANFIATWKALLPADREVLKLMVAGVDDLHGKAARLRLGRALGLDKPVTVNTPAQSLRRLLSAELISKPGYADYRVNDDAFAHWLKLRDLDT